MTKAPFIIGGLVFAALLTLIGVFGSFYTVDEGERGVIVSFGTVQGTADPGIHFKAPIITSVYRVPLRNQVTSYENLEAYTTDQQIATIEALHITYRIPADRVEEVYREYRTPEAVVDRFIGRRVNSELEKVFGQYTAERSVKERTKLSADITKALRDVPASAPLEILSVEVASISFPTEYNNRINERMGAEVEVAKKKQEVLQADQDRLKAQHEADARAYEITARADAEAAAIRVRGEAEAAAIKAKTEALKESPQLIELTKAERWDGVLPTSMIPSTAVPFLEVGNK